MKKAFFLLVLLFHLLPKESWAQSLLQAIRSDSLTISSHRGVSALGEEENSIQSLTQALSAGIYLHEIDIMESKDGKLYLLHDETLDRTTNLKGKIRDTYSTALDKTVLQGTNEPLPSFSEALQWAKTHGAFLMLDVKAAPIKKVMAEVEKQGMLDKVMLLTFSRDRTREALDYPKPYLISALIQEVEDIPFFLQIFPDKDYLIGYINKTAEINLYKKVREAGIPIVTDTMGERDNLAVEKGNEAYLDFIREKKPDILVSDYPLLLKQAVDRHF
jgi:glycerophosphoryl diester phosphodiesterase